MSSPKLERNARLFKDGVVIGYAKDISFKASADLIKEYSMDSLSPAIVASGKQTFTWSAEKLYIDGVSARKSLFLESLKLPFNIGIQGGFFGKSEEAF